MWNRREVLMCASAALAQSGPRIRTVDIVHHTHTDIGYTDLPSVVRDRQKRYLDSAIDLCRGDKTFRWTVESLVGLDDWWQTAPASRRAGFLRLVRSGQMDVMGLPFNQTPFLNALQWKQMFKWIPTSLWRDVNPQAAMQNDVNGFPRAGALLLLDHGIKHLLMGINADSGGPPFRRPDAFWWRMPDQRKLFVWLGEHYGSAMNYLGARNREGLPADEATVRAGHAKLVERIRKIESEGYPYDRLLLTFTHPASYDNGWPFPQLAPFIAAWNRLGLQPELRLTTATDAVLRMENLCGGRAPVLEGEWTDWWANGSASGPRELAASRAAKRYVAAALSPAWGPLKPETAPVVESILKDLCLFDEHTWGASASISAPYALETLAQYNEKSELAYRPMGQAEWLLQRRAKTKIESLPQGQYVANPSPAEFSGWAAGKWVESLPAHSVRTLPEVPAAAEKPEVALDANGWPSRALWPGMSKPLFDGALGDFICAGLIPPADRRSTTQLHANVDATQREEIRRQSVRQTSAAHAAAKLTETPHTLRYEQPMRHPRIDRATRSVELWKRQPRARVTVRFDRLSSLAPEVLFLAFDFPEGAPLPVCACGGVPFTPYRDQLKGSCRDYFGIDGWAHYRTAAGDWLWVTRDAPLVAIGGPHTLERHQQEPAAAHRILAIAFDNCWHTNFVADSHGTLEFQFELLWKEKIDKPGELAEALSVEPIMLTRSAAGEPAALMNNLYRP